MKIHICLLFILFNVVKADLLDINMATPIRQGVHVEWYRTVCPGKDGAAIFVWSDTRFGMRNVFAHKIDKNGNFVWGETGTVITDLPGRQEDPVAIEDGSGGAFIAWVDYRFDDSGDIFIQHVDSSGSLLMDLNGVALAQQQGQQISINMSTDSLGGVFVTWQDKRGGVDDDIYGTHVDANHNVVSQGSGVPIVVMGGTQSAKSIEYAGNNEAFICWSDSRLGENIDIYGQRLNVNMEPIFEENGIPIANTEGLETRPRTTFVSNTTSFVTWKSGDEDARILYQFIDDQGLVFDDAKSISNYDAIQTSPRVKRSKSGEVFISWKDLRSDPVDGDIYMQKIDNNGDVLWADGVQVDPTDGINFSGRFASNNIGGFDIFWEKGVFPNVDILFQSFDENGSPLQFEPVNVAVGDGYQFAPNIISGSGDSVFVVYADQGSGSIDLKVNYYKSMDSLFDDDALLAIKGLDGDVKYNKGFSIEDQNVLLMWEDNRENKKIYGNKITVGSLSHFNGNQVSFSDNSSTEIDLSSPYMIYTSFGVYASTFDATETPKKIRINKLDANLNNVWGQNGIALTPQNDQRNARLVDLGENGVGCFWSESRSFISGFDVFFQAIDADGNIQLVQGGISVAESNGDDYVKDIVPTPDGNYLIFWVEEIWPASRLKFNKITPNGTVAIGWPPSGHSLSDQSLEANDISVKKISDSDGVLAVWNQDGNFSDVYAQKISWDGEIQWTDFGVPISTEDNDQSSISFDVDSDGLYAFISWEDYRNGSDYDIVGKEINVNSGFISSEDIYFSSDSTNQQKPLVKAVAPGEFVVIWEDGRGYYNSDPLLINGVDLYGSAYVVGFGRTTGIDGIPISVEYHDQKKPQITKYSGDDYLLHWIDLRSSGKEDLANYYAKTIRRSDILSTKGNSGFSKLPESFNIESVYPNPFNGKVTFDFTVSDPGLIEFKVFDIGGRLVLDDLIVSSSPGKHRVSWDGRNQFGKLAPSGIYYYKATLGSIIQKGKVTYLK
tara:strand:- start:3266 stop:6283 length:3018 start_codon:yes stop_codon:yes gene_type:complete